MYYQFNFKQLPIITYMNRNVTSNNWKHFARTSEEYILFLVHEGAMYIMEDGMRFALQPGDAILLQPGCMHVGYHEASCDYSYIHFSGGAFTSISGGDGEEIERTITENRNALFTCNPFSEEIYEKSRLLLPKCIHIGDYSCLYDISQCMDAAIRAFDRKVDFYKHLCSCKAVEILVHLSSAFTAQTLFGSDHKNPVARNNLKVQQVLSLLHSEYSCKLNGDYIARQLHGNFDVLNRGFKKYTGLTIFHYLNTLRINKAKELLMNGNLKLAEIASKVGFCDEYRFCKAFKQMVGTTPRRYHQA